MCESHKLQPGDLLFIVCSGLFFGKILEPSFGFKNQFLLEKVWLDRTWNMMTTKGNKVMGEVTKV